MRTLHQAKRAATQLHLCSVARASSRTTSLRSKTAGERQASSPNHYTAQEVAQVAADSTCTGPCRELSAHQRLLCSNLLLRRALVYSWLQLAAHPLKMLPPQTRLESKPPWPGLQSKQRRGGTTRVQRSAPGCVLVPRVLHARVPQHLQCCRHQQRPPLERRLPCQHAQQLRKVLRAVCVAQLFFGVHRAGASVAQRSQQAYQLVDCGLRALPQARVKHRGHKKRQSSWQTGAGKRGAAVRAARLLEQVGQRSKQLRISAVHSTLNCQRESRALLLSTRSAGAWHGVRCLLDGRALLELTGVAHARDDGRAVGGPRRRRTSDKGPTALAKTKDKEGVSTEKCYNNDSRRRRGRGDGPGRHLGLPERDVVGSVGGARAGKRARQNASAAKRTRGAQDSPEHLLEASGLLALLDVLRVLKVAAALDLRTAGA